MTVDRAAAARAILGPFVGARPNGAPAGVLACTLAHGVELRDGHPAPVRRPADPTPPRLHYAVIETDPAGVPVLTFPRGTQDLLVRPADGPPYRIELGQRRTLLDALARIRPAARARWPDMPRDTDWDADLRRLHVEVVEALLADGARVEVEPMRQAAARETREEHGLDLDALADRVVRLDLFVEPAPSKRRRGGPIDHWIYAAWLTDFDAVRPRSSVVEEQKNPRRLGRRYVERGTCATLDDMRARLAQARAAAGPDADPELMLALRVCGGRLDLLARIERALVDRIGRMGIPVASDVGVLPAHPRTRLAFHPERLAATNR